MRSYLRWGRGSPKPRGQWARRLGSQYPGNPGLRRNRGRQGPAVLGGKGGAGSWVAQSFRICPILCSQPRGGRSLCEGLSACSHDRATLKVEVCRPPVPVFPCSGVQGPPHSAPAGPPPATSCALGPLFSSPPGLLCRTFLFEDSSGPSVQVPSSIHRVPFFAFSLRLKTSLKLVVAGKGACSAWQSPCSCPKALKLS